MTHPVFERTVTSTTCPYCGVGCGVYATADGQTVIDVTGDPKHPANFGKLCVKGSNLHHTVGAEGRLLHPSINGQTTTYQSAIEYVAKAFQDSIALYGPDSVAMYVSGQILTEDYYIANKFMKGFVGSANIDTNSRLCMSSAVAAYKRAFGSDTVPCTYTDLEEADVLVLVGSNAAYTHPILYQRMQAAKQRRPELQIIVIDPRHSATVEGSDLHLPIYPGTDTVLFNGLLQYLYQHNVCDKTYIEQAVDGFESALAACAGWDIERVARVTGVTVDALTMFYTAFAEQKRVVTFYSQGVNQSEQGVTKAHAIINCHLAQGKIGYAGAGPFSITGQPNAMGGREVGGLANMLAAHMDIENPQDREWVSEFWQSERLASKPGLKAVDLFASVKAKQIKVLWIMATNPVVSMPNRNEIEAALAACDCVIVSDCYARNDTLAFADVILPSSTWSEKDGMVTNSERRISRQRGIVAPPGEAVHDWQVIRDVARAMGWERAFAYSSPREIFCEHAALSGWYNGQDGAPVRDFNISALSQMSAREYEQFKPTMWPITAEHPEGNIRLFADKLFYTPNRRAVMWPTPFVDHSEPADPDYPWVLMTGRYRDQWHTMTRTGRAAELALNQPEPYLHISPKAALELGIAEGNFARVNSRYGEVVLPVKYDIGLREHTCFAPIHWTQQNSHGATISRCVSSRVDPISGQPDSKFVAVNISAEPVAQYGQIWSREAVVLPCEYWTLVTLATGVGYFTGSQNTLTMAQWLEHFVTQPWSWHFIDATQSDSVFAIASRSDQIMCMLALGATKPDLPWSWLVDLAQRTALDTELVAQYLRRDIPTAHTRGKLVCSCFQVGKKDIEQAIASGCDSVDALGQTLHCGTNCGSCKSELQALLNQQQAQPLIHLQAV